LGKAINDRDRTELSQCPRLHDANLVTPWRVARPNFPPPMKGLIRYCWRSTRHGGSSRESEEKSKDWRTESMMWYVVDAIVF
jgi:hypothetical protein